MDVKSSQPVILIEADSDDQEKKSIPFVFCTTSIDPGAIRRAYPDRTVQGYFRKGASMEEMRRLPLGKILPTGSFSLYGAVDF